jgi:hypothetical protein
MSRNSGDRVSNLHVRGTDTGNAGAEVDTFVNLHARGGAATAPTGREGATDGMANGRVPINATMKISCNEEVIDLAGASSALSESDLLPANSLILGIVTHAVEDFTTPTTYDLGDEGSNTRFGDNLTNDDVSDGPAYPVRHLALATMDWVQVADEKVKVTPNAAGQGKLHVAVYYMSFAGGLA